MPVVPSASSPGTVAVSASDTHGTDTRLTPRCRPATHHWSWSSTHVEALHCGTTMHTVLRPLRTAPLMS